MLRRDVFGGIAMVYPGWEGAAACAVLQSRVIDLASQDWQGALEIARGVPLAWYRVQSLASVAASAPESEVDVLLAEAETAAAGGGDEYRRVAVLAWVIDAAVKRGRDVGARRMVVEAATRAPSVTPTSSRAAMLELMLARAVELGEPETRAVLAPLLDAAAELRADPVKKWWKWGRSYQKRAIERAGKLYPAVVAEMTAERRWGR